METVFLLSDVIHEGTIPMGNLHSLSLIWALYGPGLPLWAPSFRDFVQNPVQFYTLFPELRYSYDSRQSGHFTGMYKTLLYAFGRPISGLDELQDAGMKRRPVFATGFRAPSYGSSYP